jgi:hypothetical protein
MAMGGKDVACWLEYFFHFKPMEMDPRRRGEDEQGGRRRGGMTKLWLKPRPPLAHPAPAPLLRQRPIFRA